MKEALAGDTAAAEADRRLGQIVEGTGKVTAIVGDMDAGSREQAASISAIQTAVGEMDTITQQNAASAEESSSAASELAAQAEQLAALVATFQLDLEEEQAAPPAPAAPPPAPGASPRPGASGPPAPAGARRPTSRWPTTR